MTRPALQRVLERIEINEVSGCWLWTGAKGRGGYGIIREEGHGRTLSTHRVTYEGIVGRIPDGYQIDHFRCDNPPCCNPDHLLAVPPRQNVLRGDTVAAGNAAKTHCPQGHPYDEENTRLVSGTRKCKICSLATLRKFYARRKAAQA